MICIDVGNSFVKLWRVTPCAGPHPDDAVCLNSFASAIDGNSFKKNLEESCSSAEKICYVSVVPAINNFIESFSKQNSISCLKYDPEIDTRISFSYISPGHDRIAAAAGAASLYNARDFIVVDAGTAVKVDLVIDRFFRGGVIFPGIALGMRALAANTAQLPELDAEITEAPGSDTASCMRAGVSQGFIYSVSGFIDSYRASFGELTCYITGGFGEHYFRAKNGLIENIVWDPALLARSLADFSTGLLV